MSDKIVFWCRSVKKEKVVLYLHTELVGVMLCVPLAPETRLDAEADSGGGANTIQQFNNKTYKVYGGLRSWG